VVCTEDVEGIAKRVHTLMIVPSPAVRMHGRERQHSDTIMVRPSRETCARLRCGIVRPDALRQRRQRAAASALPRRGHQPPLTRVDTPKSQ
jgi:hypothetical protein